MSAENEVPKMKSFSFAVDRYALGRMVLAAILFAEFFGPFAPWSQPELTHLALGLFFLGMVTMILLGYRSRWAFVMTALVLISCKFGEMKVGYTHPFRHHHITLLFFTLLFFSLLPCDFFCAIRPIRDVEHAKVRADWTQPLFRALLSSVYLFAGINKLRPNAFHGEKLQIQLMHWYFGSITTPDWLPVVCQVLIVMVCLFELFLAFAVWRPRLAVRAWPWALILHLLICLLFPVNTFSAVMVLLWLMILPADYLKSHLRSADDLVM